MPDTIRLFIAIELSDPARKALAAIQAKLKTSNADVKWVDPGNIHLTLKFLGAVGQNKTAAIKNSIEQIAGQTKAFNISLSEIGAFPNLNSPRVIWVGIKEGTDEMKKIADALENEEFSAHATLGRVRSQKNKKELKEIINDINKNTGQTHWSAPTVIDHITLFQSTLTPKGPVYTILYEAMLKPI